MWSFFFHHVNSRQTLLFFLSFFLFFLLRMHWFRKTPWHVVSAGSIRRSQLAFSWSSAYLSRPCHASRCFINISKNRRRPVFFTCHRSLRSSSWKLQAKLDAIYVLTKEEYTVWLTVQSVFFSFLFLSLHDSFRERDGRGHLWIDVRRERVGLRLPSHTSRCSPLVSSPRSWRKERLGPRWEGGALGPENLLPVKKRRWKPIN